MTESTQSGNGWTAPAGDEAWTPATLATTWTTDETVVLPPASTVVADVAAVREAETITCPECGTAANVTLNRRDAVDFCRTCDYPLFWTPAKVVRDSTATDESLRRLPGTEGRATIASLPCPHCAEPNSLSAQICVRCGRPMHVVAAPPPPEPVYLPPPILEFEEEEPEEPPSRMFAWIVLGLMVLAIITLVALAATHVLG